MGREGALRVSPSIDHFHAVDARGTLLRASWRHEHGFVNVSLWRGETCVETFHLEPTEAAELLAFLAGAVSSSMATPTPRLGLVGDGTPAPEPSGHPAPSDRWTAVRQRAASTLEHLADRLR